MNILEFQNASSAGFPAAQRQARHSRWQRRFQRIILCFVSGLALIGGAAAQDYPTRQIVVIVPFPAGGSTDIQARILPSRCGRCSASRWSCKTCRVRARRSAWAVPSSPPPDGYTLSIGNWTSHVGAGAVYPVPWHPVNDLEPVAMLSTTTLIIAGRTGLPVNDGKELIAWLKANPDQATMATVGAGSGAHVCGIYFEQKTGTRFRYVPYKGGGPVMADLLGNQVDLFCGEASQMLPHFKAGRIKPLMVMSKARWRPLPEIPTMEELGASDTYIAFWQGMWAPKGTPKHVIAKLNDAVVKAFADPAVIKRLTELGQDLPTREQMTPEALAAYHKSEIDKWWPLIKGANIKVE